MGDLPKKALSIRQPWAWAIINAGKDVENREWHTTFRGPVCIHASKGMTKREWADAAYFMFREFGQMPAGADCTRPQNDPALERGGIVGVATITDCVRTSPSPWFFGTWGFVLADVRPVPFIPVKGALGFFDWQKAAGNV